jgi:hypothetical protein
MQSTRPGKELTVRLNALVQKLGDYPHACLNAQQIRKQGTRLLKAECLSCGYTVRITKKWIEEVGLPVCPAPLQSHPPTALTLGKT